MSKFPAIPTVYNNIQMRSRLEARWAAFMDLTGLKGEWRYEPLDLAGWIPDFTFPIDGKSVLVEVKPATSLFDLAVVSANITPKLEAATHGTEHKRIMILGAEPFKTPPPGESLAADEWVHFGRGLAANKPGDDWRCVIASLGIDDIPGAWIEAGNMVQWKSPRGWK